MELLLWAILALIIFGISGISSAVREARRSAFVAVTAWSRVNDYASVGISKLDAKVMESLSITKEELDRLLKEAEEKQNN